MNITITRGYLKKIIFEEINRYFKINKKRLLEENNLEPQDIQKILKEILEKSNGIR